MVQLNRMTSNDIVLDLSGAIAADDLYQIDCRSIKTLLEGGKIEMNNKRTEEFLRWDQEHIVHSKWPMGGN